MGKIYYIMGKSASGKDTLYHELLKDKAMDFHRLIPYTTRPVRSGEKDGEDYFFTDSAGLEAIRKQGRLVELRTYETVFGPWHYFTVDDGQLCLAKYDYLVIGTLESYCSLRQYFGADKLVALLIELDDGMRLQRALDRERAQKEPKYAEMCRRFLADTQDFSEEKIQEAGIGRRFQNENLQVCLTQLKTYIRSTRG